MNDMTPIADATNEATKTDYREKGLRLIDEFVRSLPDAARAEENPLAACPGLLPGWLDRRREELGWSRATWFAYRSAITFCLKESRILREGAADRLTWPAVDWRRSVRSGRGRTSTLKMKRLPEEALADITAWLEQAGGRCDPLAALWLRAGLVAGLRPSEWETAVWQGNGKDRGTLRVRNGKYNPALGRGNGEFRNLIFAGPAWQAAGRIIPAFLQALHAAMEEAGAKGADNPFLGVRRLVQKRIQMANRALWGKSGYGGRGKFISLYSARHQFAANVKSAGGGRITRRLVAALMGHRSDLSAARHYCRRHFGANGPGDSIPTVPPEEKASVRERSGGCQYNPALRSGGEVGGNFMGA